MFIGRKESLSISKIIYLATSLATTIRDSLLPMTSAAFYHLAWSGNHFFTMGVLEDRIILILYNLDYLVRTLPPRLVLIFKNRSRNVQIG